jgi:hypothetical protein
MRVGGEERGWEERRERERGHRQVMVDSLAR